MLRDLSKFDPAYLPNTGRKGYEIGDRMVLAFVSKQNNCQCSKSLKQLAKEHFGRPVDLGDL